MFSDDRDRFPARAMPGLGIPRRSTNRTTVGNGSSWQNNFY